VDVFADLDAHAIHPAATLVLASAVVAVGAADFLGRFFSDR